MSHALASISTVGDTTINQRCVLVVSDSTETITDIDNALSVQGFAILVVSEGKRALNLITRSRWILF